jgi:uncharacterized Zn-binding protein involved in type VI secretion
MPAVARLGDPHSHGGTITMASTTTFANEIRVARLGDAAICPIHGAVTISSASTTVTVDGIHVARVGDSISCGAVISQGSPTVFAG